MCLLRVSATCRATCVLLVPRNHWMPEAEDVARVGVVPHFVIEIEADARSANRYLFDEFGSIVLI